MRISSHALSNHLENGLAPLYLVFGNETLLCEEALEQLRQYAEKHDYSDRLRFTHEPSFDWSELFVHSQSLSLFSEKRIIELRIPSSKPGDAGAKALIDLAKTPVEDTTLIVICGAIEKRAQTTKWFKEVEQQGVVVECPNITTKQLPQWIAQRLQKKQLAFDSSAVEALCQFTEGNLLAAVQEINLLALLYPDTQLNRQHVENFVSDHARFNVYGFVDACLAGDVSRCVRILNNLRRTQPDPIITIWLLAKDVRVLCRLAQAVETGVDPRTLYQRLGVWSSRAGITNNALKKLSRRDCEQLLRRISRLDLMSKGNAPLQRVDIWEEIESIALAICGARIP